MNSPMHSDQSQPSQTGSPKITPFPPSKMWELLKKGLKQKGSDTVATGVQRDQHAVPVRVEVCDAKGEWLDLDARSLKILQPTEIKNSRGKMVALVECDGKPLTIDTRRIAVIECEDGHQYEASVARTTELDHEALVEKMREYFTKGTKLEATWVTKGCDQQERKMSVTPILGPDGQPETIIHPKDPTRTYFMVNNCDLIASHKAAEKKLCEAHEKFSKMVATDEFQSQSVDEMIRHIRQHKTNVDELQKTIIKPRSPRRQLCLNTLRRFSTPNKHTYTLQKYLAQTQPATPL